MIKKLFVIFLLVVISQATFTVFAGMHFPGTAAVDNGTFNGTARVEGFGNNVGTSTVSLHLAGSGLIALCAGSYGGSVPGAHPVNIDITSPAVNPNRNGNARFQFTIPLLPSPADAGCPANKWNVVGLKGTLFATYTAKEYKKKKPDELFALATLGFQCNIDDSVNTHTNCAQIFETAQTF